MRILATFIFAVILVLPTTALSTTIYVPDDYSTIQGAIDASSNGDAVVVRPGTYLENIDFVGKMITVQSEQGAAVTTIDGNQAGSVVAFQTGENENSRLDGFTITNGSGTFYFSFYRGGGTFCAYNCRPTIENNTITGNTADQGGGTYGGCLENNTITENTANSRGGGIDNAEAVKNNVIVDNIAYGRGGGIHLNRGPGVENCIIAGNMADYGGGICCSSKWFTPTIEKCTIVGNLASYGGGICTQDAWPSVTSSILWDNNAWHGPQLWRMYTGDFDVDYCDVKGGWPGANNIDADPLFVDPANSDYHLQQDPCQPGVVNPCVDSGDPNAACTGSTRTDGVEDSWPLDMGFHYPVDSSVTIYVPDDYPTIQEAIDASWNGDIIIVRPGTYVENINFIGKAITVQSEQGAAATTIDGNQSGSVATFISGEGLDSVLEGFMLTNGTGSINSYGGLSGGGVYCSGSSPTISNNTISNNSPYGDFGLGGGISCESSSSPLISDNTITGNTCSTAWYDSAGGGINCQVDSSPIISYNIISENSADWGGGISCNGSSPTITNNTISRNSAGSGGGIECWVFSAPLISNNTISGNDGGGIECYNGSPVITYNIISNNTRWISGGGIECTCDSSPIISNNIISHNTTGLEGGGIACYSDTPLSIVNNVISKNSAYFSNSCGGGIYCENSSPTITNTILWENSAASGPEIYVSGIGGPYVTYCDVKGGWPGTGNIDADPFFADASVGDYHITWNSPCLDAGDNSVVTESFDLEGDPRIALGNIVDIGADEYWFHTYHIGGVIPGSSIDLKVVGWPTAPVTLALDDGLANPPVPTPHGDLYLPWPPYWYGNIGNIPSSGILTLPVPVPLSWSSGDHYYLQSLIGPWDGPYTRLSNLLTLTVE